VGKWVAFVIQLGPAGIVAMLLALAAVWWVAPTTGGGTLLLLLIVFAVAIVLLEALRKLARRLRRPATPAPEEEAEPELAGDPADSPPHS
jgi:hypothetical protein